MQIQLCTLVERSFIKSKETNKKIFLVIDLVVFHHFLFFLFLKLIPLPNIISAANAFFLPIRSTIVFLVLRAPSIAFSITAFLCLSGLYLLRFHPSSIFLFASKVFFFFKPYWFWLALIQSNLLATLSRFEKKDISSKFFEFSSEKDNCVINKK